MKPSDAESVVPVSADVVTTSAARSVLATRGVSAQAEKTDPAAATRSDARPRSPIDRRTDKGIARGVALAPREAETLDLLARGHSYAQTAALLGVSISTIQTYVKKIYRKLGVTSRSAAVLEAYRRGLLAADLFAKRR